MADQLQLIEARNKSFKELFDGNDMETLSNVLYAPNCKMMVPGEKTTEGRADVKKLLSSLKNEGASLVTLHALEVGPPAGECPTKTLYERGDYVFAKEDNTPIKMGKYLVIWKLIDGEYKRYTEILNSGNNNYS